MHASTLVLLVTSPFNMLLSYFLIHRTSLGFIGAPIAISITYHLSFLLIIAYARWGPGPPHPENDGIPDMSDSPSPASSTTLASGAPAGIENGLPLTSNKNLISTSLSWKSILAPAPMWGFLRLALPGILMVATEWWAFEIVALAAGRLGRLPLAAQGVIMTADQSRFPC